MKHIQFHGHLAERYPQGISVHGDSAAECIAALQNYPGFRESDNVLHQVFLPHFQSRDAIYEITNREVIEVHPIVEGAGGSKWATYLQIIIGVVLIATGWGAAAGSTILGMSGSTMVMTGALLVLGGVTTLLMPQPKLDTNSSENDRSNYLNANKNTVKIGTRIPLIFGRRKWYGHYLSFNVTATDVGQPAPLSTTPGIPATTLQVVDYTIQAGDGV